MPKKSKATTTEDTTNEIQTIAEPIKEVRNALADPIPEVTERTKRKNKREEELRKLIEEIVIENLLVTKLNS